MYFWNDHFGKCHKWQLWKDCPDCWLYSNWTVLWTNKRVKGFHQVTRFYLELPAIVFGIIYYPESNEQNDHPMIVMVSLSIAKWHLFSKRYSWIRLLLMKMEQYDWLYQYMYRTVTHGHLQFRPSNIFFLRISIISIFSIYIACPFYWPTCAFT